ncbi:MAG: hypothetical protein V1721_01060 [Pseudomonadota bacterium]
MFKWSRKGPDSVIELADARIRAIDDRMGLDRETDPVEKILKAEKIKKDVDAEISERKKRISIKAGGNGGLVGMGGVLLLFAGIAGTGGGVLIPTLLALAGVAVMGYVAPKVVAITEKRLVTENSALMSVLEREKIFLQDTENKAVKDNVAVISASSKLARILEISNLAKVFAIAAANEIRNNTPLKYPVASKSSGFSSESKLEFQ